VTTKNSVINEILTSLNSKNTLCSNVHFFSSVQFQLKHIWRLTSYQCL